MVSQSDQHSTEPLRPRRDRDDHALECPSAQPDWQGARAFGVVLGTPGEPRVGYLPDTLHVTADLVGQVSPVGAGEVFRIAAKCATSKCRHYGDGKCQLAARTVDQLAPVADRLPRCQVRPTCRWWNEQGKEACLRCPQVVTNSYTTDPKIIWVATPQQAKVEPPVPQ